MLIGQEHHKCLALTYSIEVRAFINIVQEVCMIYELALIADAGVGDEKIASVSNVVAEVAKSENGEVLVTDDWGTLNFAQAFAKGVIKGRYLYYIFKSSVDINTELLRRFKIDEDIIRSMVIKLGEDGQQETILKRYRTPFSKKFGGSVLDDFEEEAGGDVDKDRKNFVRRKTCWFTAKNIKADWKDPATFLWLINEFGKIYPARISGISRKHQRHATASIKRARQMGVVSHLTSGIAK